MPRLQVAGIIVTFLILASVWCLVAHWFVSNKALGKHIRTWGRYLMPWVLMALGIYIMAESNVLSLLHR